MNYLTLSQNKKTKRSYQECLNLATKAICTAINDITKALRKSKNQRFLKAYVFCFFRISILNMVFRSDLLWFNKKGVNRLIIIMFSVFLLTV